MVIKNFGVVFVVWGGTEGRSNCPVLTNERVFLVGLPVGVVPGGLAVKIKRTIVLIRVLSTTAVVMR